MEYFDTNGSDCPPIDYLDSIEMFNNNISQYSDDLNLNKFECINSCVRPFIKVKSPSKLYDPKYSQLTDIERDISNKFYCMENYNIAEEPNIYNYFEDVDDRLEIVESLQENTCAPSEGLFKSNISENIAQKGIEVRSKLIPDPMEVFEFTNADDNNSVTPQKYEPLSKKKHRTGITLKKYGNTYKAFLLEDY